MLQLNLALRIFHDVTELISHFRKNQLINVYYYQCTLIISVCFCEGKGKLVYTLYKLTSLYILRIYII